MKKITLSIILFSCFDFGFGQVQYSNYLDDTSEWRYYYGGWNGISGGFSMYITKYFDGVETINGIVYYKEYSSIINNDTSFTGEAITETSISGPKYIREDSSGKFYILGIEDNTEYIYFDNQEIIDAQIGDVFPVLEAYCNVESIETIYLGSVPLKKVNGSIYGSDRGSLEGVGKIGYACSTGIEVNGGLVCYTKQGINIQFKEIDCDSFPVPNRVNLSVNPEISSMSKVQVYPNPTDGILIIDSDSQSMIINYFILNLNGSIVKNGNIGQNYTEINISDLSNGIYFLKIENENSTEFRKIVKK